VLIRVLWMGIVNRKVGLKCEKLIGRIQGEAFNGA
jgi:hypothetical protein